MQLADLVCHSSGVAEHDLLAVAEGVPGSAPWVSEDGRVILDACGHHRVHRLQREQSASEGEEVGPFAPNAR